MRILMLGGTSLTGPHAVRRLHALGHDVTVFHRGEHEADLPAEVRHVHGAWPDPPRELLGRSWDAVVHMWAMTEDDTRCFVEAFRGRAGRAVVISSGDVYRAYGRLLRIEPGPPDPVPLREDAPLRESRYPYRAQAPDANHWMARYDKILVERVVMGQSELPAVVLRFPAILGGPEHRFGRWMEQMESGAAEIRIPEDWAGWRWTHGLAEDAAAAVVLAATRSAAAGRIYNVGRVESTYDARSARRLCARRGLARPDRSCTCRAVACRVIDAVRLPAGPRLRHQPHPERIAVPGLNIGPTEVAADRR